MEINVTEKMQYRVSKYLPCVHFYFKSGKKKTYDMSSIQF